MPTGDPIAHSSHGAGSHAKSAPHLRHRRPYLCELAAGRIRRSSAHSFTLTTPSSPGSINNDRARLGTQPDLHRIGHRWVSLQPA